MEWRSAADRLPTPVLWQEPKCDVQIIQFLTTWRLLSECKQEIKLFLCFTYDATTSYKGMEEYFHQFLTSALITSVWLTFLCGHF
jgi:hypothetical protein